MQKIICAVRDITADVFGNPFTSVNEAVAMRDFGHACQDPNSALSKNPEEFQLYRIGLYDDATAAITTVPPALLANATQYVKE